MNDIGYIRLLSHRLERFRWYGNNANFRCVFCGDSKKSKRKARGYLIESSTGYYYACHNNCGATGKPFWMFLKEFDYSLYNDYTLERLKTASGGFVITDITKRPVVVENTIDDSFDYSDCISIDSLSDKHPVVSYLRKRSINDEMFGRFLYVPKFVEWVKQYKKDACVGVSEHPRLVIPFYDKNKKSYVFQARAFGSEIPKYITIKAHQDSIKIFGLDTVDCSIPVYVFEGPIDSMFIKNSIAVCSSQLRSTFFASGLGGTIDKRVFIWDNEPRNIEIVKLVSDCIDANEPVVIWDSETKHKDVNDMIVGGMSMHQVLCKIKERTYVGIVARLKFNEWKRI
jgi:hypothetical protein